ncbi:MAG: hypothetical protein ACRD38_03735 [Nitrososphaerales archaeon]
MVWIYVVIGLVVVIGILILMKSESRSGKGRFARKAEPITGVTYVCMHCGNTFQGSSCPKCGSERKPIEFGR